jgi:hypothetical protein
MQGGRDSGKIKLKAELRYHVAAKLPRKADLISHFSISIVKIAHVIISVLVKNLGLRVGSDKQETPDREVRKKRVESIHGRLRSEFGS